MMDPDRERPNVLVVSFSDLAKDPRVKRQIRSLMADYHIVAIGYYDPVIPGVDFKPVRESGTPISKKIRRMVALKTGNFQKYYDLTYDVSHAKQELARIAPFDLIIANDNDALPFVFAINRGSKVLHDAHEYSPKQNEESWTWRFLFSKYRDHICRSFLHRCASMMTVSSGISQEYEKKYGVKSKVVTNASEYREIPVRSIEDGKIRMVHHGVADPSRNLPLLIETFRHLPTQRFHLTLMLISIDQKYLNKLKRMADGIDNVSFVDPVPMEGIVDELAKYDMGIHIPLSMRNFNHRYSLPNKFFEFIQARLGLIVGNAPEMSGIVENRGLGLVVDEADPVKIARAISQLDPSSVMSFKENSAIAARDLSAQENVDTMRRIVRGLIG